MMGVASRRVRRGTGMAIVAVATLFATEQTGLPVWIALLATVPAGGLIGSTEDSFEEGFVGGLWRGGLAGIVGTIAGFTLRGVLLVGFDIVLVPMFVIIGFFLTIWVSGLVGFATGVVGATVAWYESRGKQWRKSKETDERGAVDDPFGWTGWTRSQDQGRDGKE